MSRILVVDANKNDAMRIAERLGRAVCDCRTEWSEDCLQGKYVLAVVCWDIAGAVAGPEIVLRLKRKFPALPIIVTLGSLDLSRVGKAMAMGAVDCLKKAVELNRLKTIVDRLLQPISDPLSLPSLRKSILGDSPALLKTLRSLAQVIDAQSTGQILITGENGTGKELLAQGLHTVGPNGSSPFVAINIAAIPDSLVESTLFGHEKGAFTDANAQRIGAFEQCAGGTLFLDEIGDATSSVQAKLLRAIEQRKFMRVGGTKELEFNGQLVSATNRNLEQRVAQGMFREDLYYRLTTHVVRNAPLRERQEDIELLAAHFLIKHSQKKAFVLAREAKELLNEYPFPGNVRELENFMISAIAKCVDGTIGMAELPIEDMMSRMSLKMSQEDSAEMKWRIDLFDLPHKDAKQAIESDFGKKYKVYMLGKYNNNLTKAAQAAGIDPKTFRKLGEKDSGSEDNDASRKHEVG